MANGSFTDTPEYKKLRKGAKWGQYDEATLADALQGKGMDATAGIGDVYRNRDQALADPLMAGVPEHLRGDVLGAYQQGGDLNSYQQGLNTGFSDFISANPEAGNPMSGGMSFEDYRQFFPEAHKSYLGSDSYRTAVGTMPSAGNPAAISDPSAGAGGELPDYDREVERGLIVEPSGTGGGGGGDDPRMTDAINKALISRGFNPDNPRAGNERGIAKATEDTRQLIEMFGGIDAYLAEQANPTMMSIAANEGVADGGIDPGMKQMYQGELDKARNLARQGRTDFNLQDASIAAGRMGLPNDIESLRAMVMKDFVTPAGAASGPAAQPAVTAVSQETGTTFQPSGPSADAAAVAGGVTDPVLRKQQMEAVRELVTGAEEAGAETRTGLPGLKVADPNLDIQLDPATAPVGGPDLFATDDVQYDPNFFKYETDLGNIYLDALRQSLGGEGGMDPQTAAQMADAEARQVKDEAQTTEDLQRLGVLRGGGDTADVLGELRSGYGRTYSDILSDQAYRQQNDPRYQAALDLAGLKSDRYMEGGEMVGRLGGQDTLEARLANQEAIEREADISGFLRGARSLEGRDQDINAQFGRADRQLEEARVLAPQYGDAADLARSDARLQQDIADRNLARGLTITEPTTRERFEEGVRGTQEAEALARAGVSGYLDEEATLARDTDYNLVKELDTEESRQADKDRRLERELAAGEVALDGEGQPRTETIAGEEAGSEERMLSEQLDTDEALARIDAKSRADIQGLINEGSYDEAEMLMGLEKDMQSDRLTFEQQNLIKELKNLVTLGQIDMFGAQDLQAIINKGDLDQAELILDGIEAQADATLDVAEEQGSTAEALAAIDAAMQTERVDSEELVLLQELKDALELGKLDAATAVTIQRSIARGEFSVAQTQLAGIRAQADATVDVAEEQGATAEALAAIDERINSTQVNSEERVLLEELSNLLTLGQLDAATAVTIQRSIARGEFSVAQTQLSGIRAQADATVDVAEAQGDTAEAVRLIDERINSTQVSSEEKVLLQELKDVLELGKLAAATAVTIQRSIARGEFSVAQTQLAGIRAQADATVDVAEAQGDTAEAVRLIDERINSTQVSSEEKVLLEELKTEVTLGRIDAASAKSIQNIIMKGDLAESRQQLAYAREIAGGTVTIDGVQVPTIEAGRFKLEEALTEAQLQQLVKTEQGQSIANLLALVQTLEPGSVARGNLEAEIATQISNTVDDAALEEVLLEMLSPITVDGETGGL